MNTILFYFSGTGNSLFISRKIAERLEDSSLEPILPMLFESSVRKVTAKKVGFIFPVYFFAMPEIVRKAIDKLQFAEDTYFFAVATNGGDAGNSLFELDTILRGKNSRLHFGIEIPLGDNSIAIRTSASEMQHRLSEVDPPINGLVQAVIRGDVSVQTNFRRSYGAVVRRAAIHSVMRYYYRYEERKVDTVACTNCGLCRKVCPVNNIYIENGEVRIGENCAECFACINCCPNQAIHFGRIHPRKETQYHAPGVTATDTVIM